jgi:hypothetical protein
MSAEDVGQVDTCQMVLRMDIRHNRTMAMWSLIDLVCNSLENHTRLARSTMANKAKPVQEPGPLQLAVDEWKRIRLFCNPLPLGGLYHSAGQRYRAGRKEGLSMSCRPEIAHSIK